jgi:ribonuclease R
MAEKRSKRKSDSLNKKMLKGLIHKVFNENPTHPYNYKQICKKLEISDQSERRMVLSVLSELADKQILEEIYSGKYRLVAPKGYVTGILELPGSGIGIIRTDEVEEEVVVSSRNLNQALNGDTVKVYLYALRRKGVFEGEVVEVLKRQASRIVGVVSITRGYAFLIPDGKSLPYDIFIPPRNLSGAKNGEKAIVEIAEWPAKSKNPVGRVVEVLGYPGEHEVEMHAIMAEFDLPFSFPAQVEEEAKALSAGITPQEIKKRRDFRNIPTFTIDPADAKDFDDALSVQPLPGGKWEVGVHIADVTHYVQDETLLEKEAAHRATSVYLVDRVVPMLPEALSNEICSLKAGEDKLCYSAVFVMDPKARVEDVWFGRTVIHSARRFSYEEAQSVIETGKGDMKDQVLTLHSLATQLRQERFRQGAIGFEKAEVKFNLDDKGKPLGVFFRISKESNHLIEEFMLLANRHVAEFIGKKKAGEQIKPFVYRVHDRPDRDKLAQFAGFVKQFGLSVKTDSTKNIASSLNALLREIQDRPEKNMIESLAIRAMARAEYSTDNIGHYGLAFKYYTHFTSPIRRYPDMMVHRLLDHYLNEGRPVDVNIYSRHCRHSSEREGKAAEAERASVKFKQAEFLGDKIGNRYDGIISGVTEWGLYVELSENKCEGMVPLRTLDDDFYVFDEKNFCIYGRYSSKRYRLGDQVVVQVARVNIARRQVDLKLLDSPQVK